jgi:hypothetical protein
MGCRRFPALAMDDHRFPSLFLIALLSFAAPPAAAAPRTASAAEPAPVCSLSEDLAGLRAELLAKAEELAERAQKAQANVARDELYRAILCIDPDHKEARKVLGFAKGKQGWTLKKYVPQKDRGKPEDLAAIAEQRGSLGVDFERRFRAALEAAGAEGPAALDAERRELLAVMWFGDDNIELRRELGFEFDEEAKLWRMSEVLAARADRAERKELLERLLKEVPEPEVTEVDETGAKTGIGFPSVFANERALVCSTGKPEEAKRVLQIMHIAPDFLSESFRRSDPTLDQKWFVYDLANPNLRRQFYQNHPDVKPEERERFSNSAAITFGFLALCGSGEAPANRYDCISLTRAGQYLRPIVGLQVERGWAWAGLSTYLSYQLCGTRLTQWIQDSKYSDGKAKDLGERLVDPKVDWLLEARLLLEEPGRAASLRTVLGRETKDLGPDELVIGYAFCAYLFEGRREDLCKILDRMREGQTSPQAVEGVLSMSVESASQRLLEWLQAMTGA